MKALPYLWIIWLLICNTQNTKGQGSAAQLKEQPGKIKGMGDIPGLPEGELLKLPSWLKIDGQITGCDEGGQGDECQYDGTGGEWVSVKFKLKSTYPRDTTYTLPEGTTLVNGNYIPNGLIIISQGDEWQHGYMVERFPITIVANPGGTGGSCTIKLLLYCLNKDKKGSDSNTTYVFGPVITSPLMKELMVLLKPKKIKFSDFDNTEPTNFSYGDVTREIQEIIYHITNGKGLTQEDRNYIKSIPNKKI
ncbi:hypothetical protein SAMN05216436_120104 [bacterium A37T11]|nr:hypothetical protein SAMN05216436_120104 [bacterium A37T11]